MTTFRYSESSQSIEGKTIIRSSYVWRLKYCFDEYTIMISKILFTSASSFIFHFIRGSV